MFRFKKKKPGSLKKKGLKQLHIERIISEIFTVMAIYFSRRGGREKKKKATACN